MIEMKLKSPPNLVSESLDRKNQLFVNADNGFWAIVNKQNMLTNQKTLTSFYGKVKNRCREELNRFRFSAKLSAIYIDPTDRCNAHCPYCYVPAKIRSKGRSMTEAELESVLKKIAEHFQSQKKKPVIIFHASEPLLVKDILFKAIEKYEDRFYFGIQTNALLLEKSDVDFIKKHGVSIGISLDAADEGINNRLRVGGKQGGNYQNAVQAIEWFRGYEGLNVITTMTKFNIRKLPELVRFLHKKEVRCVLINPVRLTQENSRRLKPDENEMAKYFLKAVDTALKCTIKSGRKIIVGSFSNTVIAIIAPTARRLMCDISPCGGGRCFFTITASGEMIPCGEFIGLDGFSGGNIFRDSIPKAMQSSAFKAVRGRWVEKISDCNVCLYRNICGAPCPAELHALGNMNQRAIFCEFYKKVIQYAFRLIAQGKEKYVLREEGLKNLRYEYCF
ncbi:MAG: peptide-modifying radical SAM enzyme CbpB [Candidatus Omnitrophica bacterium]|nr:peptide-modifying radical SAM enzyme CbpB [Candidatus Omnitrophota bacterium]